MNIVPKVNANPNISDKNVNYGLVPLNDDGSITVRFNPNDKLDVNIAEIGSGYVSYGGTIFVEVNN